MAQTTAAGASLGIDVESEVTFSSATDVEHYRCSVCHHILRASCGNRTCRHFLCEACVKDIADRNGQVVACPICRCVLDRAKWIPDVRGEQEIARLDVECKACRQPTTFGKYTEHREACPMRRRPCVHGCGEILLPSEQQEHDDARCMQVQRTCKRCKLGYTGPVFQHDCMTCLQAELEAMRQRTVASAAGPSRETALVGRKAVRFLALLGNSKFATCNLLDMFAGPTMVSRDYLPDGATTLLPLGHGHFSDRHFFQMRWEAANEPWELRRADRTCAIELRPGTTETYVAMSTKSITDTARIVLFGHCPMHPGGAWFQNVRITGVVGTSMRLTQDIEVLCHYSTRRRTLTRLDAGMSKRRFVADSVDGDALVSFSRADDIPTVRAQLERARPT